MQKNVPFFPFDEGTNVDFVWMGGNKESRFSFPFMKLPLKSGSAQLKTGLCCYACSTFLSKAHARRSHWRTRVHTDVSALNRHSFESIFQVNLRARSRERGQRLMASKRLYGVTWREVDWCSFSFKLPVNMLDLWHFCPSFQSYKHWKAQGGQTACSVLSTSDLDW